MAASHSKYVRWHVWSAVTLTIAKCEIDKTPIGIGMNTMNDEVAKVWSCAFMCKFAD